MCVIERMERGPTEIETDRQREKRDRKTEGGRKTASTTAVLQYARACVASKHGKMDHIAVIIVVSIIDACEPNIDLDVASCHRDRNPLLYCRILFLVEHVRQTRCVCGFVWRVCGVETAIMSTRDVHAFLRRETTTSHP